MNLEKLKIVATGLFMGLLVLVVPSLALAQTYSSFNDCLGNNNTEAECCAMPASNFSQPSTQTSACGAGGSTDSTNGTNLIGGSTCVSNAVCASGLCSNGICTSPGVTPSSNLGNSSSNSSGSSVICDTSNGYTMQNGLCLPNSPFSGGLASQGTLSGLITTILNIVLLLAGIIAVIFIIIGGYQYMTAGGNEESAEKGRRALTNAIIGLVIVILAFTIVQVVTNALTSASPIGK